MVKKVGWYSDMEWLKIFESCVETLGGIPPIQDWKKELGIPFHVTTISHYLAKKYPNTTYRLKSFVEDLKPGLSLFLKRKRSNGTESISQNIKNFIQFCVDRGGTPTYSEYSKIQRSEKKNGLPRIERLLISLNCNKYTEVVAKLGLPPPPEYTNDFYTRKLLDFGLQIESEVFFKIEDKPHRIDYKITLDSGRTVYLEIDGSSHISVNSKYHLNATFWKKGINSAEESFKGKKERDARINKFFNENNIPLLRVKHHHFLNLTKDALYAMFQEALLNKVPNYNSEMEEKANKVKDFLLQGMSVAEIGRQLKHSAPYIFHLIKKYDLAQYQKIKVSDVEKQMEDKMFQAGILYEKGSSLPEIQKIVNVSSCRIRVYLQRLGLLPVEFPDNFDYLAKTVRKKDSEYSSLRELKKLRNIEYITAIRQRYVKYKESFDAT